MQTSDFAAHGGFDGGDDELCADRLGVVTDRLLEVSRSDFADAQIARGGEVAQRLAGFGLDPKGEGFTPQKGGATPSG